MHALDVALQHRLLADLPDVLLHLLLRQVDDFLDPRRVDAAVRDQLLHRDLRHLAPHRVEAVHHDHARRVVDDHVHAGRLLEARMFRPSRPMIRPFMSSLGISTLLVVPSLVTSAA